MRLPLFYIFRLPITEVLLTTNLEVMSHINHTDSPVATRLGLCSSLRMQQSSWWCWDLVVWYPHSSVVAMGRIYEGWPDWNCNCLCYRKKKNTKDLTQYYRKWPWAIQAGRWTAIGTSESSVILCTNYGGPPPLREPLRGGGRGGGGGGGARGASTIVMRPEQNGHFAESSSACSLTHLPMDKIDAISQTIFSDAF